VHLGNNLGEPTRDVLSGLLGRLHGGEDVVDADVDRVAADDAAEFGNGAVDVGVGEDAAALLHNGRELVGRLYVWHGDLRVKVELELLEDCAGRGGGEDEEGTALFGFFFVRNWSCGLVGEER